MPDIKQYTTVEFNVEELIENDKNPRVIYPHSFRALNESLERFGNLGVLIFNERSGRIVGGNQRLSILKSHGIKTTLGYKVDMDDEEEMALLVTLNNQGAMGTWDVPKAFDILEGIRQKTPEMFDRLNFAALKKELDMDKPKKEGSINPENVIPEMELMPFEHWDYVVIVFKDSRDWLAAAEFFGIKKVKIRTDSGKVKIGLGRVVDGANFLRKVGIGTGEPKPKAE